MRLTRGRGGRAAGEHAPLIPLQQRRAQGWGDQSMGAAHVDPLSPENPLIFSAGPFAGSAFSNANRTSVGCKSPLTGGVKEANGGGTFSYGLGQVGMAGFTLLGAGTDWTVIHFTRKGEIRFDDATPYLGKGNYEVAELLHAKYGKKVTLALCGPFRVGHRVVG